MILAYYNEIDKNAAEWLRQLIRMNLITDGVVDERSIVDVQASDLNGFDRVHLFAGIGGWEYALKLAGWPDDRPVWTASLPCQPFSVAGKGLGKDDERHLLPHFLELVRACKPRTIYGEQVPGAIKHGWLDDLCTEMGAENYTVRADVRTAAGAGAPHIRQRVYWVANAEHEQRQGRVQGYSEKYSENGSGTAGELAGCGSVDGMAYSINEGSQGRLSWREDSQRQNINGHTGRSGAVSRMGNTEHNGHFASEIGRGSGEGETESGMLQSEGSSTSIWLGNAESPGYKASPSDCGQQHEERQTDAHTAFSWASEWNNPDWIYCRDDKYRPIKSSSIWLVNGVSCRMVQCSDNSVAHIETNEKEMTNAEKASTNTREILPELQCKDGEEEYKREIRRFNSIQEKEILQSSMYGESIRRSNENRNIKKQSSSIKEAGERLLSGVWKNTHTSCSSCGRDSYKQLTIEFDDIVCKMPQGSTFAKFLGTDGSEYMQALRQASNEDRALLDSQYTAKEVWESLDDKEKDRVRVHFNNGNWIFEEGIKPLVNGLPKGMVRSSDHSSPINADETQEARVMRLKGYGNAICPQTAEAFIRAFMGVTQ